MVYPLSKRKTTSSFDKTAMRVIFSKYEALPCSVCTTQPPTKIGGFGGHCSSWRCDVATVLYGRASNTKGAPDFLRFPILAGDVVASLRYGVICFCARGLECIWCCSAIHGQSMIGSQRISAKTVAAWRRGEDPLSCDLVSLGSSR